MTPAGALLWQIGWRHRWGLVADAAYLFVALAAVRLLPDELRRLTLNEREVPQVPLFLNALCVFVALHLFAMFSALDSITGQRRKESDFPTHLLVLPVSTRFLVAWPMALGCLALSTLWLVVATHILRPCGIAAPLWWPMAVVSLSMAVLQATTWMPLSPAWLRTCIGVPVVAGLMGIAIVLGVLEVAPAILFAGLVPLIALAYFTALHGVAMTRRGEVYDCRTWQRLMDRLAAWRKPSERPFRSPGRAQLWYECRGQAWFVPLFVLAMLFVLVPMLLGIERQKVELGWRLLAILLAFPPFLASTIGAALARPDAWSSYALGPFLATRPLSSAALVRSKFQMCAVSAVATWAITLIGAGLLLLRPGLAHSLGDWAATVGWGRAGLIVLSALGGSLVITWIQMATSLWLGLTGREWLVNAVMFSLFGLTALGGGAGFWLFLHPQWQPPLRAALPWIAWGLVLLKLLLGIAVTLLLVRWRLFTMSDALRSVRLWLAVVTALAGVAIWLVPRSAISLGGLLPGLILLVPFARLVGSTLTLDWNRHR